jgi:hypothetical protein
MWCHIPTTYHPYHISTTYVPHTCHIPGTYPPHIHHIPDGLKTTFGDKTLATYVPHTATYVCGGYVATRSTTRDIINFKRVFLLFRVFFHQKSMNPQNKAPVELPFPLPISLYCSASEGVVKAELALAKQKLIGTAPKQKKVGLCARETRTPFTRTASVVTVKNVTWIKVDARAIHAGDSYLDDLPWYAKKKRGDRVHPRAFHSTYKGTPCPTLGWNADDAMLEPDTPVVTRTYECNG